MQLSGFDHPQSVKIILAGLSGYETIRKRAENNGGNINRSSDEGMESRRIKKLIGKSNWFKDSKKKADPKKKKMKKWEEKEKETQTLPLPVTSVLFVPKTRVLQKRLQGLEQGLSAISSEQIR